GAFSLPGFAPELAGPYINKVLLTVTVGSTLTTTPIYGSLYEYMDASGIGSASISDSFHPPALTGANGSYSGYIVGNPFSTYNVLVSYKCTPITSPPGPGPSADCWVV